MRTCNKVLAATAAVLSVSLPATAMAHPGHAAPSAPAAHAWMHVAPWLLVLTVGGIVAWRRFGRASDEARVRAERARETGRSGD